MSKKKRYAVIGASHRALNMFIKPMCDIYNNVAEPVALVDLDFERIALGPEQAEIEIRTKVGRGKKGGGYIYHADHSVPPTMSLEAYRHVLDLVRRYGTY